MTARPEGGRIEGGQGPGEGTVGPVGVIISLSAFAGVTLLLVYLLIALWTPTPPTQLRSGADTASAASVAPDTAATGQRGAPNDTSQVAVRRTAGPERGRAVAAAPGATVFAESTAAYCTLLARGARSEFQCVRVFGGLVALAREQCLLYLVLIAGALGSLLHVLRSLGWYIGNRKLTMSWIAYYVALPFAGGILALVFYVVIRAGLFTAGGSAEAQSQSGFVAVAMLVGLFSNQAVLKLKEVAELFFTKPPTGANSTAESDASALSVTGGRRELRADGYAADALVVTGTGFQAGCVLTVNGVERAVEARSATELALALTADDLQRIEAGGDFEIVLKNPDGRASKPFDFA